MEVLEDAGFQVTIPAVQLCCGRPLYDYGMLDLAKTMLREVLEALRPQIREGICVVGLEPSCVSVFRDEMTNLLGPDEDAKRLKEQTYLLTEFLAKKAPEYAPPRLHRKALVQQHCHHKSILDTSGESKLFDAIGLDYEIPDTGCCGMAGPFGFDVSPLRCIDDDRRARAFAEGACRRQGDDHRGRRIQLPRANFADDRPAGDASRASVENGAWTTGGNSSMIALPELRFMPSTRAESARAATHGTIGLLALCGGSSGCLADAGEAARNGRDASRYSWRRVCGSRDGPCARTHR